VRKDDLERFRKLLLAKRALISGDVSTLQREALRQGRNDTGTSSMPIHMADLGSDNYEQEFALGLIESEELTLREIDEALYAIDKGTYGTCEACDKKIPMARLKAKPQAKLCIDCKRLEEKGLL
jgi:DnaK suppressor protein